MKGYRQIGRPFGNEFCGEMVIAALKSRMASAVSRKQPTWIMFGPVMTIESPTSLHSAAIITRRSPPAKERGAELLR